MWLVQIVQFGGKVFKTEPLSPEEWGISVGIGALSLVVGAVLRLLPAPDIWCCRIKDPALMPVLEDDDEDDETTTGGHRRSEPTQNLEDERMRTIYNNDEKSPLLH